MGDSGVSIDFPLDMTRRRDQIERMNTQDQTSHLDGKMLIAMPGMRDTRFDRSVIFMCSHSEEGAMGLIVNKPAPDLNFKDLLEQLEFSPSKDASEVKVHLGGPVENGRGFVLHSPEYGNEDTTLQVDDDFGMTATLDILEDISNGDGPKDCLLALGYAGWGPGQLEGEIQANGWLTCDASRDLVFGGKDADKWTAALASLGISPSFLSAKGGTA